MRLTDCFAIERGSFADLRALARYHYAGSDPGVPAEILRAIDRTRGELAGVLVVSHPALNDAWRERAWPGAFERGDARTRARAINALVRTISRVIVEPRRRSMGVGTMMVRAYLGAPLTALTETVASMGRYTSMFERSGMRIVECARAQRDYRLLDALAHARIAPIELLDPDRGAALMRDSFIREEVDRWLNAARGTRALLSSERAERAGAAGRAVIARPVVYVHGEAGGGSHEPAGSERAGADSDRVLCHRVGTPAHSARPPAA